MKHGLIVLALALLLSVPSMAQAAKYDGHFGDMDPNGDGMVTWEEFVAYFPDATEEDFLLISGEDKQMDHDEWHVYKEAHGLRHHAEENCGGEGHAEGHKD